MDKTNCLGLKNATLMATKHLRRVELIEKQDLIKMYKDGATHIVGRQIFWDISLPELVVVETTSGNKVYTNDVFMLVYNEHDVIFMDKHALFSFFGYTKETRIMLGLDLEGDPPRFGTIKTNDSLNKQ